MFGFELAVLLLCVSGGVAAIIGATGWATAERIRAERKAGIPSTAPPNDVVLAELQALKQHIQEMQSTSHQFDISFDAALSRLEQRVDRLETRTATQGAASTPQESPQRVGL